MTAASPYERPGPSATSLERTNEGAGPRPWAASCPIKHVGEPGPRRPATPCGPRPCTPGPARVGLAAQLGAHPLTSRVRPARVVPEAVPGRGRSRSSTATRSCSVPRGRSAFSIFHTLVVGGHRVAVSSRAIVGRLTPARAEPGRTALGNVRLVDFGASTVQIASDGQEATWHRGSATTRGQSKNS